jgi:HEXXH motif-containing protein
MMTFEPSAERAAALDRRMRARLADSLDYIFDEGGELLGIGRDAAGAITASIRAFPQSPQMFGAYNDLVLALERDQLDLARELAAQLGAEPIAGDLRIDALDDRSAVAADRCRRLFLSQATIADAPSPELLEECRARVAEALALLDAGFPEMAEEIRGLLREIVVAAGPEDPLARTFDGASCYMMWGAILLNARGQVNVLDTAQALAHESGHNLLFGFCADCSLVDNPDEELFSSPLRKDPRPMDGVFHATYVIARMHQTLGRLLDAGVLDAEAREAALADLETHRRNFAAGDQIIREGGRLTDIGEQAIAAARAHMAASRH